MTQGSGSTLFGHLISPNMDSGKQEIVKNKLMKFDTVLT